MKVYVDGKYYDSSEIPMILVFTDDEDRKNHAENISNMEPKRDVRLYAAFPEDFSSENVYPLMAAARKNAKKTNKKKNEETI